jgi:hypothetical protein
VNLIRKFSLLLTVAAATCALSTAAYAAADDYQQEIQKWQHDRYETLKAPQNWLGVNTSVEIPKGTSRIGSGADQDIVLASGPAHLGILTHAADGSLNLALAPGSQATIDHSPAGPGSIEPIPMNALYFFPDGNLVVDPAKNGSNKPPSTVHVNTQTLKFYSYEGDYKKGTKLLLVTDTQDPHITQLKLTYFPIDPSWKVTADWEPLKEPREVEVASVQGSVEKVKLKYKAVFFKDGKRYELMPFTQNNERVLFIFADRTSGQETYGGARFLITPPAKDGKIVLDFNKAINPPCAFSPFPDCPIAIPENRLPVRVTAGEKKVPEDI